jgi:hypothetical protein
VSSDSSCEQSGWPRLDEGSKTLPVMDCGGLLRHTRCAALHRAVETAGQTHWLRGPQVSTWVQTWGREQGLSVHFFPTQPPANPLPMPSSTSLPSRKCPNVTHTCCLLWPSLTPFGVSFQDMRLNYAYCFDLCFRWYVIFSWPGWWAHLAGIWGPASCKTLF